MEQFILTVLVISELSTFFFLSLQSKSNSVFLLFYETYFI